MSCLLRDNPVETNIEELADIFANSSSMSGYLSRISGTCAIHEDAPTPKDLAVIAYNDLIQAVDFDGRKTIGDLINHLNDDEVWSITQTKIPPDSIARTLSNHIVVALEQTLCKEEPDAPSINL